MTLESLLTPGRADRGKLEKFADGCNFLARAFWSGHTVTLSQKGEDYTVRTAQKEHNVTTIWACIALGSFAIYPIGVVLTPLIFLAYGLACIPVSLLMGAGLIAKKIAMATDANAKRYSAVVQKSVSFTDQEKEAIRLRQKLDARISDLALLEQRKRELDSIEITGDTEKGAGKSFKQELSESRAKVERSIKEDETAIKRMSEEAKPTIEGAGQGRAKLERVMQEYLKGRNEHAEHIIIEVQ
jgi:hypothetical protein